ncbi:eCIS core domain-containing protein [Undibacterium terreum]|uniref:eCIS core domain-containing protein n=1 Tax=Undibacterium terreum TaxID=1224302 RepID=A0A916XJI8_9BURK|nr:DUF4157 domain-containing protein [Undibacterium terreum]GGC76783.1 hypothetical protein GCM10011396_24980 [Undibacterium terreum]
MRSNLAAGFVSKQAEQSAAASASLQASRAAHPGFIDIRPQALAQRKHQENAATSERSSQLRAIAALMSSSTQSSRMQSLADSASAGPSRAASSAVQRKSFTSARVDAQETGQTLQRVEDEEVLQARSEAVQRVEDEELLQGKFETVQRIEEEAEEEAEEEEPLQAKFNTVQRAEEEEEPLQGKFGIVQRVEDEELLQGKFSASASAQLKEAPNNTGLPNQLKSGIESLSGMNMDHVRVHYNSAKPAQLHAHAYAQGSEIHMAPGQEQHLPHEAWHVIQQAQGRVRPTTQMKGNTPVNDDVSLEVEADVMGEKALSVGGSPIQGVRKDSDGMRASRIFPSPVIQRRVGFEFETNAHIYRTYNNDNVGLVADEAEIFYGAGWKLVCDSGRMEFVSEPFDNLAAFPPIIASIGQFIANSRVGLNTDIRMRNPGQWAPGAVGLAGRNVYTSHDVLNTVPVGPNSFFGNPQVSIGTKLESLDKFLKQIRTKNVLHGMRRRLVQNGRTGEAKRVGKLLSDKWTNRVAQAIPKAERLVLTWAPNLPVLDQNQLRGFWQLITHYWEALSGYTGAGYIKARLPVMARTDFHSMYNAMTPAAQLAFQNARQDFLGLNIPLKAKTGPFIHGHAFSMGDWYDSIINPGGVMPIPQHTFQNVTRNVDLVSDDQTVAVGTNKSMGQLGMDTHDPLASRAVFELRHITGGVMIELGDLQPLILQPIFALLQKVGA